MKKAIWCIIILVSLSGCTGLIKTQVLSADDIIRWDVEKKDAARKQATETQRLIDYFTLQEIAK